MLAAAALAWSLPATILASEPLPVSPTDSQPQGPSLNEVTAEPAAPMRVVFWVGDMPESRIAYELALLEQMLEHTRDEYGGYQLEFDRLLRSQERLARDLASGEGVHVLNGPGWTSAAPTGAIPDIAIIPIPLVKGLLGYRQCIIRREDKARFSAIRTEKALKQVHMGLGQGWLDNDILRHNGFTVEGAPELEKLYHMLKRGRFDCLPLGVGEAAGSLAENDPDNELIIAENLLLFYPLPVFMQVSGTDSLLAKRLEEGLRAMQKDGTFDQLFDKHYSDDIARMHSPDIRVFRFENPLLPPHLQHIGRDLVEVGK